MSELEIALKQIEETNLPEEIKKQLRFQMLYGGGPLPLGAFSKEPPAPEQSAARTQDKSDHESKG